MCVLFQGTAIPTSSFNFMLVMMMKLHSILLLLVQNLCILQISPIQRTTEINRDHPAISQLISDLGGLVESSLFSDVQIQTGSGSVIPAHAVILAARCPKLRQVQ